ncbi:MAG: class B sortase [Ruminococcus sp.]|nr:class B sortase [Ruminococcus sp.]
MNEKNNYNNIDAEAIARAEKIKAIRKAVQEGRKPEDADISVRIRSHEAVPPLRPVRRVQNNAEELRQSVPYGKPVKKSGKKKRKKKKTFLQKVRGLFPEKGDGALEVIRKIVFLISIIAIIVCGYLVADYYIDLWRNDMRNNKIEDIHKTYSEPKKEAKIEIDENGVPQKYYELRLSAQKLLDINPDYVGFIKLPTINGDDVFALPVVQAKDNSKYLNTSFTGGESRAGTLFMDYRNHFDEVDSKHHLAVKNSDNIVIYGHNMADDSMFGALKYYYRNADYYANHPTIYLESRYEVYTYKIFAFFIIDAYDKTETKFDCWNKINFADEKNFYKFVNEAKRRTIRTNDVDVKYGDQLLTLSTCNTLLGDNGRLIIMARQVREGEDMYSGTENSKPNNNIKWPTMYFNIRKNEHYDPDAEFEPYGPEK